MDTSRIESMISQLNVGERAEPDLLDLLAAVAARHGVEPSEEQLEAAARFVTSYIEFVPYMMKVAFTSAAQVGLESEMASILDMVVSYWIEGDDVIPDELGIIGLMDDAYCSLTSMQAVSDHYRLLTGKHLFPDDLTAANRCMREIIGEPYVSELDLIVIRTMRETGLADSVKHLADEEKQLNFSSDSTIWNHGSVGALDTAELAPLGIR
jgi:uncharacterized membrane protein YkvA (DUF1232 family)